MHLFFVENVLTKSFIFLDEGGCSETITFNSFRFKILSDRLDKTKSEFFLSTLNSCKYHNHLSLQNYLELHYFLKSS